GMGLGFMMPAMFAESFRPQTGHGTGTGAGAGTATQQVKCPDCGHQQLIFDQCVNCGKNLSPNARFCPKCGHPADEKPVHRICPHCKTENLPGSSFCNNCGEKLD
ncbi:MAG: zinc ribbon domain-containing protein, partial [Thermodesulfobacteriota bacterium]|nr:zinc ribbon domain-containing protein [Thermodesulfobacteriota bacterium]